MTMTMDMVTTTMVTMAVATMVVRTVTMVDRLLRLLHQLQLLVEQSVRCCCGVR